MSNSDRKRMTPEEAEHVLMNIGNYVVFDEDYGCLIKASLMDASLISIKALRAQNAEETAPVVHGQWIELGSDDTDDFRWKCSNCNEVRFEYPGRDNYCPNCGAKMDLE